jgi:hypothetical protein
MHIPLQLVTIIQNICSLVSKALKALRFGFEKFDRAVEALGAGIVYLVFAVGQQPRIVPSEHFHYHLVEFNEQPFMENVTNVALVFAKHQT